ncbi:mitochondrial carrier domain-containing protein [Lobosporangium transversale]|uniref:Mitochondrial carrier domain-containing protein n=1 Tax=Lobosporangium transversale TaxID=64571 RepID=A0A1Y2FYV6_9FUNG|nr:mitochondrial carrier domain-containing protein [Lobosporangium transversale]ORY88534.1 mitochondrial carrier domain-containing protein [Lobosporangium transversale]|eukprot:XP_021874996.1 mitochondrial carrier domain-containing protein [Lobosporangium transversale]
MSASTAAAASRTNSLLPAMLPSTSATTNTISQQLQQKNPFGPNLGLNSRCYCHISSKENRWCSVLMVHFWPRSSLYQSSKEHVLYDSSRSGVYSVLGHIKDTCLLLGTIYSKEGPRALYKGLGPNLVGGYQFAAYAISAGIITATATNPIWLVKTRMQLQVEGVRQYKNSVDCIYQILKNEGIRGMYRGLSASYLGVAEGTIQWMIYEQLKKTLAERRKVTSLSSTTGTRFVIGGKDIEEWIDYLGAAGAAKFVASAMTYPHEVLRTRLRQVPVGNEPPKYTGLKQTFQLVLKEEGVAALYGGLTAHMMRVVPNAAIMFFCYEAIMHRFG